MSTTLAGGRIPIRLEPITGEAFDGWLDAYGQRLLLSGRDVGRALGLPPRLLRLHGANVALGDPALDPERIAWRACGLHSALVEGLWFGLSRYQRLVEGRTGSRWFARVLRPMVSSRFCSGCLQDTGGRWLAAWRLPWFLACPAHGTMLASGCPACGGTQRYAGLRAQHVPDLLTVCSRPTAGRAGRRDHRCRHDLTETTFPAPAPEELIALQAELSPIADPEVSDRDALRLVDRLVDLLITATHFGLDLCAIDRDRRNMASILAGPLAEAYRALSDPHGVCMRTIATGDRARVGSALPKIWDGASPALVAIVLEHRDQRLGPTDRLRYRSMTGKGRRPEEADPGARMSALPLALWPDWSIRLRPPTIDANRFRIAAAIALCVPGATVPVRSIREHWPGPTYKQRMVLFGRLITADPHGTAILAALCALADSLDQHGAPINYTRRRTLASQIELLDRDAWTVMCRAGGIPTGAERKLAHARLWLWETLTGGLHQQAPAALRRPNHPEFLARHNRFALRLPTPTVRRLIEHARHLLDTHGCQHEPLTWSPSGEGIKLDEAPGPDPDALVPQRVHAALALGQPPPEAAKALGITLEHLRYIARIYPPEPAEHPAATAPLRLQLAALLAKEQLRELVEHGHSLRALERRYGINRRTIRDELVAHGIPIPPRTPHRHR